MVVVRVAYFARVWYELFCVPSTNQDFGISTRNTNARHPITGNKLRIAKEDFISGAIPKEDIQVLTEVLADNDRWEEMLGYKEYKRKPRRAPRKLPVSSKQVIIIICHIAVLF